MVIQVMLVLLDLAEFQEWMVMMAFVVCQDQRV